MGALLAQFNLVVLPGESKLNIPLVKHKKFTQMLFMLGTAVSVMLVTTSSSTTHWNQMKFAEDHSYVSQ